MAKTILFDFDGTLADTMHTGVAAFNQVASQQGFLEITPDNAEVLRGQGPRQVMKTLDVPILKLPLVLRSLRNGIRVALPTLTTIPGMRFCLAKLRERGYRLGIVTSNSKENVEQFLLNNEMNLFDFIQAGAGIFGKSRAIKKVISREGLQKEETIFVGDEIRDIEAAKKNNIKVIAVTWGINSRAGLQSAEPDFIVRDTEELMGLL